MAYGVKTANIYDLLDDDNDDNSQIVAEPKQAAAKGKDAEKPGKQIRH